MAQSSQNSIVVEEQITPSQKKGVKGGPVIFWLVAGIAAAKDIVDIFTIFLNLVGLGLQVIPVVGTAVGAGVLFISMGIGFLSGMFVNFILLTYFTYIGGSLARRLVVVSIGAIIELVPGLNILPTTTIMFFLAYYVGKTGITKIIPVVSKTSIGKKLLST